MKRSLLAGVGVVLSLAVSGCGGGSAGTEPGALPPASSVPTASAAASPTPSESYPATAQGAAAFTRHWFQVLNEANQTADASRLKALSDSGCKSCANFIESIQSSKRKNERLRDNIIRLVSAESPPVEEGRAEVEVLYQAPEEVFLREDGSVASTRPPEKPGRLVVILGRRGPGWVTEEIKILKVP